MLLFIKKCAAVLCQINVCHFVIFVFPRQTMCFPALLGAAGRAATESKKSVSLSIYVSSFFEFSTTMLLFDMCCEDGTFVLVLFKHTFLSELVGAAGRAAMK